MKRILSFIAITALLAVAGCSMDGDDIGNARNQDVPPGQQIPGGDERTTPPGDIVCQSDVSVNGNSLSVSCDASGACVCNNNGSVTQCQGALDCSLTLSNGRVDTGSCCGQFF